MKNKHDYKILSTQRCKECRCPLKQNSVDKKHEYCYTCFQIRKGKGNAELCRKQRENIIKYKNHETKTQI